MSYITKPCIYIFPCFVSYFINPCIYIYLCLVSYIINPCMFIYSCFVGYLLCIDYTVYCRVNVHPPIIYPSVEDIYPLLVKYFKNYRNIYPCRVAEVFSIRELWNYNILIKEIETNVKIIQPIKKLFFKLTVKNTWKTELGACVMFASMCHCSRQCATVRVNVPLCASMCHCARQCATVCVNMPLFASMCHCSRQCATVRVNVPLFASMRHCLRQCATVRVNVPLTVSTRHQQP